MCKRQLNCCRNNICGTPHNVCAGRVGYSRSRPRLRATCVPPMNSTRMPASSMISSSSNSISREVLQLLTIWKLRPSERLRHTKCGRIIADEAYDGVGPAALLGLKDAHLALAAAEATRVPLPSANAWRDRLLGAIAHGDGDKDWAVVAREQRRASGLDLTSRGLRPLDISEEPSAVSGLFCRAPRGQDRRGQPPARHLIANDPVPLQWRRTRNQNLRPARPWDRYR